MILAAGLLSAVHIVHAADPDPLQDFCIAHLAAGPVSNGFACNLSATNGTATLAFVRQWPALNTQGLSLIILDINPSGIIFPHTHNLATEILYVLEGEMYTGFVTNNFGNDPTISKLYAKVVKKGEAFIFPRGLLHFQLNKGKVLASSLNVLNSQNPGIQLMPSALFGNGIEREMLEKSFFMNETQVAAHNSCWITTFILLLLWLHRWSIEQGKARNIWSAGKARTFRTPSGLCVHLRMYPCIHLQNCGRRQEELCH
ncbi:protein MpCupin58 [Marchantia polymorpha subsp. ruderalis]|uniref:Germin-like protein n=2 Tax=Marchantia polymorpha TaxID=3197 RepID=A0AAF6B985_MARPO|nr:hypothetical protein MARPO_0174s0022 [Marchantia polymorpha]BBN08569.1 hypothetical protein Mp_4g12600 [Marchantia polymorpha subsp. ruderalis]|eukprot:PTQ28095.1 hypothetical protein MARPO_0174s0022 [Marchantia polymorpha]